MDWLRLTRLRPRAQALRHIMLKPEDDTLNPEEGGIRYVAMTSFHARDSLIAVVFDFPQVSG